MAIDIEEAKTFIKNADKQSRDLELEKAKLEQQKEFAEKGKETNVKKMEKFGCTPETIESIKTDKESKAKELRTKIEGILNKTPKEDSNEHAF